MSACRATPANNSSRRPTPRGSSACRSRSISLTTICSAAASRQNLLPHTTQHGSGVIAFCPLASGLLTDKYLDGVIPPGARGALWPGAWVRAHSPEQRSAILTGLNRIAASRGQTLAQMALAWILRSPAVTSVAVGASRVEQIEANVKAIERLEFSADELAAIDQLTLEPPKAA